MNTKVIDMMGKSIVVPSSPQRIISLVPSQTELLFDLGLGNRVVGITKFCIHPNEWFRTKTRVGGTKQLNFEIIKSLSPDLIIGNKEENNRADIEALSELYPVWMSDIIDIEDALSMITRISNLTQTSEKAAQIVTNIAADFDKIALENNASFTCAYFIWKDPYMVAASGTFIDNIMSRAGFSNVFNELSRYPEISLEDLSEKQPDVVMLSSEPYPFGEMHIAEFEKVLPNSKIKIVDGELFSWYGSRLQHSAKYLKELRIELDA